MMWAIAQTDPETVRTAAYPWVGPLLILAMIVALAAWRLARWRRHKVWDALADELQLTNVTPKSFDDVVALRQALSRHVLVLIAGIDSVERRLVGTLDRANIEILDFEGFGVGHWAPMSIRTALRDPELARSKVDVTRDRPGFGELLQTAVIVRSPTLKLPRFLLMPENYLTRRVPEPRGVAMDEDAYPLFMHRNRLIAADPADEPRLRRLFNRKVQIALEPNRDLTLEGHGDTLLIYRIGHALTPPRVRQLLLDAAELCRLFEAAG